MTTLPLYWLDGFESSGDQLAGEGVQDLNSFGRGTKHPETIRP